MGDEGLTISDIRSILDSGGQIYQNLRVQSDTEGTRTYNVPIPSYELEYLLNSNYRIQPANEYQFSYTRIKYSGRSHEDSIVIVLMGDGFTAEQYAPMTTPGRVLWHANRAIDAMVATPPFDLFACLFTVYVVHVDTPVGQAGFLGTVTADRNYIPGLNPQAPLIRAQATRPTGLVAGNITMIQVLQNARTGTGQAQVSWGYGLTTPIMVARTSLRTDTNGGVNTMWPRDPSVPAVYNGTAWHGTFIHEFGHSFGVLRDEHDNSIPLPSRSELSANSTAVPDAEVKWQHWAGYRNVLEVPTRFIDGWAAPSAGLNNLSLAEYGCIMASSGANYNFCGVCTAELVRRMALISEETFHGRSPSTNITNPVRSYPWILTPTVTMPEGTTRILDSAFHGNTSIQTVHIPDSVETIGDFAFIGTTNLRTIYNNRIVPQQINSTTFAGVTRSTVTVMIPFGTTQAYLAAGWHGFRLVETDAPDLSITLNFYGRPDAPVVLPVTLGQPLCPITVANVTRQVAGEGPHDNNGGWAFWGWFTDAQLDSSGRVRDGHRRPTVGDVGFDIGAVMTAELIGSLAVNGNVDLHAIWARWGDLNDDDRVDIYDLEHFAGFLRNAFPRPVINMITADVNRDIIVNIYDLELLSMYMRNFNPRPILGQRPVSPAFVPFSVGDLAFGVSQERGAPGDYVLMRVSVAENTALGFNVALLDVGFDSDVLEFVGYIGGNYNAKGMRLLTTVHTSAYPQEDDAVRIVWIRCIYETTSYTDTGLYLELEFRIRDNAQSGTSEINLTAPYFGGAVGIGGNVPLTLMPGSVHIIG